MSRMDQESTGTEDDANAIKNSLYLIDDISFYFQVGCYTVCAMLVMYMSGMLYEKHTSKEQYGGKGQLREQGGGGGDGGMYNSKYTESVSDTTTADFY